MSDESTGVNFTRRRVLAGAAGVGVASAAAGFGTSAYLTDTESFLGNTLEAGELDLYVHYDFTVDQGSVTGNLSEPTEGTVQGGEDPQAGAGVSYELADVKPGDSGLLKFCFSVVDNPAYLWMDGGLTVDQDNVQTEPEEAAPGEQDVDYFGAGTGELAGVIQATLRYCREDENGELVPGDVITTGSLGGVLADLAYGLPVNGAGDPGEGVLERTPFGGNDSSEDVDEQCICLEWEVPISASNEIQGDQLEFDLAFYAEQERNNAGAGNATLVAPGDDLQQAVDDASSGDTLLLEAGTHSVSSSVGVDTSGLEIRGEGPGHTTVQSDPGLVAFDNTADNVRFGDMRIEFEGDGSGGNVAAVITSGASGALYSNLEAEDLRDYTTASGGSSSKGLRITGNSDHGILREIHVTGCGNDGVTVWNSDYCWGEELTAEDNGDNGIYFNGLGHTLINSTARNNDDQGVDVSNDYNQPDAGGMVLNRIVSEDNANGGIEFHHEGTHDGDAVQIVKNCQTANNDLDIASQQGGLVVHGSGNDGTDPEFDEDDIEVLANNDFQDGIVVSNGTDVVDAGSD